MADKLIPPLRNRVLNTSGLFSTLWEAFIRSITDRVEVSSRSVEVSSSWPSGLTITGVASSASITISAHTREYPSGAKSMQAGTVTGQTYGATVYVYFDDATRNGGLVTYAATSSYESAFPTATYPNRHFVGKVTMPANAGASNTTGTPARPPGYA